MQGNLGLVSIIVLLTPPLSWSAPQDLPICEEDKRRPQGAVCAMGTDCSDFATCNLTRMGEAVAVDGDYAIVGGPNADRIDGMGSGNDVGGAWIFRRDPLTSLNSQQRWFQEKLVQHPFTAATQDQLGFAVAVSGDLALIGAPNDGYGIPFVQKAGRAFVFRRNSLGDWAHDGPPAISIANKNDGDFLGWSVDIDGTTSPPSLVVGAPQFEPGAPHVPTKTGSAHVFEYDSQSTSWQEQATLPAPGEMVDMSGSLTEFRSEFGMAVAMDGDTILVGAPLHDHSPPATDTGGAYVYVGGGTSWSEQAEIVPLAADVTAGDEYGSSVDIRGDTAVVGAPRDDPSSVTNAGAAYVFQRSMGAWGPPVRIAPMMPLAGERFGTTVSISNGRIVVGCRPEPGADVDAGEKAYLFELDTSTGAWNQVAILSSGNATVDAEFGCAAAISDDSIVVGAPNDDTCDVLQPDPNGMPPTTPGFPQSGAAYFLAPPANGMEVYCTAKTNSANCVPFIEVSSGFPSASDSGGFALTASWVVVISPEAVPPAQATKGITQGHLMWSTFNRSNLNYHGGKLCVKQPFRAEPIIQEVYSPSLIQTCAGSISLNFNSVIQSETYPELTIGGRVKAQWTYTDPWDTAGFGDGLTDAIEFTICP